MSIPFESYRVPERTRELLIQIKRKTQIEHWNVICRWCFCLSVAQSTTIAAQGFDLTEDSSTEINWRTLFGEEDAVYSALLRYICKKEGIKTESKILPFCKLHIHRGAMILNRYDQLTVVAKTLESK
jgi:DNA sulfur modification protein DndE